MYMYVEFSVSQQICIILSMLFSINTFILKRGILKVHVLIITHEFICSLCCLSVTLQDCGHETSRWHFQHCVSVGLVVCLQDVSQLRPTLITAEFQLRCKVTSRILLKPQADMEARRHAADKISRNLIWKQWSLRVSGGLEAQTEDHR